MAEFYCHALRTAAASRFRDTKSCCDTRSYGNARIDCNAHIDSNIERVSNTYPGEYASTIRHAWRFADSYARSWHYTRCYSGAHSDRADDAPTFRNAN